MEPFYIRQNGDLETIEARRMWFAECMREAGSEGAELCRCSVYYDGKTALVEGWKGKAHEVVQGEPRFMIAATI